MKDNALAAPNLTNAVSSSRAAVEDTKNNTKTNVILIHKPSRSETGIRKVSETGESSNKKVLTMIDSAKLHLLMNSSHIQTLLAYNSYLVVITNFYKNIMKSKSTSNDTDVTVNQIASKDADTKDLVTVDSVSYTHLTLPTKA